jgi:hypothetical protein
MDIFTAFGLSVSAGLNAYIPLLIVALIARFTDWIELTSPWNTLESWWVIAVLIVLGLIEFFADKIPAVNHVNDLVQTFIRPVAGALVFAASTNVADVHPVLAMVAGLLISGGVHAVKAVVVRPAVTATTGGTGNVPVSVLEDVISTVLSILAIVIPVLIAALVIIVTSWIVWWLWRRANRQKLVQ